MEHFFYRSNLKFDHNDRSDLDEKLQELQESIQRLTLLKQIGAENLVNQQEKEVFRIQQDLLGLNKDAPLDIIDTIPKKCRFCDTMKTDDERLECYEKNFQTCKKRESLGIGLVSSSFFKVFIAYAALLLLILTFSMLVDVFFKLTEDKTIVFATAAGVLFVIIILFRAPFKALMRMLG